MDENTISFIARFVFEDSPPQASALRSPQNQGSLFGLHGLSKSQMERLERGFWLRGCSILGSRTRSACCIGVLRLVLKIGSIPLVRNSTKPPLLLFQKDTYGCDPTSGHWTTP